MTLFLSVERISPNKLPHQAGWRNLIVHIRLQNKVQDLDDGTDLLVTFILRLYRSEQGENMLLQHRQLIEGGAVEDHVGIFLIGEDPPPLPPADAVPHGQGMLHRCAPGLIVPDDPPQQP